MENNLVNIFIGSDIEANFITTLLIENHIEYQIRNLLEESISAGWASGSTYNSSIIQVDSKDAPKAKNIINEYLKNRSYSDESIS